MAKCRQCGRYFKTRKGLNSHMAMVRRTGRHYPRRRSYRRSSYRRRRY